MSYLNFFMNFCNLVLTFSRVRSNIKLQGSNEPSQLIFFTTEDPKMGKITLQNMINGDPDKGDTWL